MADPTPEERAAAERRKVLRIFGILEADLRSLRTLDPEEAIWRIEHEFKIGVGFLERRREFLKEECVKKPKRKPRNRPEVVVIHDTTKQAGVKVG